MLAQTRQVLPRYIANGGACREVTFPNCAHTPFIEKPYEFMEELQSWLP